MRTVNGRIQFISKFDSEGALIRTLSWEQSRDVMLENIVIDQSDDLLISGSCTRTENIDPDRKVEYTGK